MLSKGPTQDARFCTMCLYVYDELRRAPGKECQNPALCNVGLHALWYAASTVLWACSSCARADSHVMR